MPIAAKRGTYAGLIEKIPYLVDLGIKTVELMPVQQFDAQASPNGTNYWGYQPIAWFAPHRAYSSRTDAVGPVHEFRDMVKALHRAGIEVILDVVFNHTAEGDETGPTLSLRGFDNPTYYILDPSDKAMYVDDTGCGNTINGNEPFVRRMILDCLRYWVEQMHVDGFRFDLAASLSRGEDGQPLAHPPILLDIETDPVLAGTKIIAEAWDAAGLYQVANFCGDRWAVWNGQFRDHVRRFVRSDAGTVGALADNLVASANLFQQSDRLPSRSVNFITAHDGFTLNDLVTYNDKHNEANGESNRDGTNDNESWNCGVEGPTDDPAIEALRRQQIKNFFTILLMSEGRPMLLMGDEVRRTQHGNNNAYCQDNATFVVRLGRCRPTRRHPPIRPRAHPFSSSSRPSFAIARSGASRERLKLHGMACGSTSPIGVTTSHSAGIRIDPSGDSGTPARDAECCLGASGVRSANDASRSSAGADLSIRRCDAAGFRRAAVAAAAEQTDLSVPSSLVRDCGRLSEEQKNPWLHNTTSSSSAAAPAAERWPVISRLRANASCSSNAATG